MQGAPGQGEKFQPGERVTGLERRGRRGPQRGERAWGWARCARGSPWRLQPAPSACISSIAAQQAPYELRF